MQNCATSPIAATCLFKLNNTQSYISRLADLKSMSSVYCVEVPAGASYINFALLSALTKFKAIKVKKEGVEEKKKVTRGHLELFFFFLCFHLSSFSLSGTY